MQWKERMEMEKEEIEEVREIRYLGYILQKKKEKNGGTEKHIQKRRRRVIIAMKKIWSIGERIFKENYKRRMKMFDALVGSVALYQWRYGEIKKGWNKKKIYKMDPGTGQNNTELHSDRGNEDLYLHFL